MAFLAAAIAGVFGWVDTDNDDLEVFARGQVHHFERAHQAIKIFGAEDLALVVDQREDHGLLAKVISQLDCFAGLVAERSIKRQLLAQPLIDFDRVENIGETILGRITHSLFAVGSDLGQRGRYGSKEQ